MEWGFTKNSQWCLEQTAIFFTSETQEETISDPEQIPIIIEELIYIAKQLNLEVDNDDVQELLDSHNQELTIDEFIKMRQYEQDIVIKLIR